MVHKSVQSKEKRIFFVVLIVLIVLLISGVVMGILLGPVKIRIKEVFDIFLYKIGIKGLGDWSAGTENIVWLIRFPRVLLAIVVGATLSISGVILQTMTQNDLAEPYTLGISSGASLGAVLAIGFGLFSFTGVLGIQLAGFLGASISFLLVFFLSKVEGRIAPNRLILAGIGVSYVFSGITSLITLTSGNRALAGQILSWTLGSLSRATWQDLGVSTLILLVGAIYLVLQSRNLDLLSVSDEFATTLGLDTGKFRGMLFILVSLMTGIVVSVSGSIGFVGLTIPHIVHFFIGNNHKYLIPISGLLGGFFLIAADLIARTLFSPTEIPVGVITSLIGGPIFISILLKNKSTK